MSSRYKTWKSYEVANQEYDYIIIGGGTAGCVVAARLSEDPSVSVLLLERGPIIDTWASYVPFLASDYRQASSPVYSWSSESVDALGRTMGLFSGKAMGGTSKINSAMVTWSTPGEYNAWKQQGRQGWGWEDVKDFFRKSEKSLTHTGENHRGQAGPWVNQSFQETYYPWSEALSTASPSLGIPFIRQSNDPASPAVYCSRTDVSVNEKNQRISAFDAFLPPELVKTRKNLTICTRTVVLSLELQDEAVGPRAVGVYIQDEAASVKAKKILVSAKREIVLSAGAIGTPQILLLSGIGDPKHLNSVGIEIVHELPGVGLGLQDHLAVALIYKAPRAHTFYELMHNRVHALRELLKYVFTRKGMFLSSYTQVAIFARSALLDDSMHTVGSPEDLNAHSPANVPDLEIQPIAFGIPNDSEQHQIVLRKEDGAVSLLVQLLRPKSSGSVKLKSKNPRDRPKCDLGALKDANDYVVLRKGIKLALALGQRMKEDGYPSEPLDLPRDESDAALDEFVKGRAISTFHYSSTCRMAPRDLGGVVDDQLRVHGVVGLRIADASIFPTIPACHLQAPVVMVGERCADFIKKTNTVAS